MNPLAMTRRALGLYVAFVMVLVTGCSGPSSDATTTPADPQPLNVIIVSDLSDRLAHPQQRERDRMVLRACTQAFQERCRRVGYPLCKDVIRFQSVRTTPSATDIQVDVGALNAPSPGQDHSPVVTAIGPSLDRFVVTAMKEYDAGFTPEGADLWLYFKDQFGVLLKPGYRNKVILLTDGYLNFDPATQATRPARTYMQVGRLRVVPDWRTEFPKVALAATGTSFHDRDVEMVVLEVAPKLQPRSIHETEILQRYWTSFCDSIGVQHQPAERSVLTNTTPESEVRRLLTDYLAGELKP